MWKLQYSNETLKALSGDERFDALSLSGSFPSTSEAQQQQQQDRKLLQSTSQKDSIGGGGGATSSELLPHRRTETRSSFSDTNNTNQDNASSGSGGSGRLLPELGNVDVEKLREFRESFTRKNTKGSLRRLGDFTMNKLDIHNFKNDPVGRDDEIEQLNDMFQMVLDGQGPAVATIEGPSGTGKTVLAQQLGKTVRSSSSGGFFCTGQFDPNRNEPYTGFSQAMSVLAQQILSRDQQFVDDLVKRIQENLVDDLQMLLAFIPKLKNLGFKTPTHPHHFGEQEQINVANRANQVHIVLRKFIRVLCNEKLPLVLVLDDVHWADPSSVLLMTSLATDAENKFFCLVTTSHPEKGGKGELRAVSSFFESLQSHEVALTEIELEDLIYLEAHTVVCTALRANDENPKYNELSRLVYEKTHGNPYFMLTFLQSLVDKDMLEYNLGTLSFIWNLDAIKGMSSTENVGELAVANLGKLSSEIQSILQVSSCLSQTFNRDELLFVIGGVQESPDYFDYPWPDDIDNVLSLLCVKGIFSSHVLPGTYSFVHGQTQAAAFNLVPFMKRAHFKLTIGRRLLEGMGNETKIDQHLCLATDLCNFGLNLLGKEETELFAKWNLLAGEYTLQKGAFTSALTYFESGIFCLGRNYWKKFADIALALHCGAAEAAYCCGDFEKNEKYSDAVLESDQNFTVRECFRVHASRISVLGAQECFSEAIDIGLNVVKELGIADLPKEPGLLMVLTAIMKSKRCARGLTKEKIMDLSVCNDENRIYATKIINVMGPLLYQANPNLLLVLFLKCFRWAIKYGATQDSVTPILTYGLILVSVFKQPKDGFKIGEAALEFAKARNLRVHRAAAISVFYGYIYHWSQPVRHAILPMSYGHQLGMETGDTEVAFLNIGNSVGVMLVTGAKPLPELVAALEKRAKEMQEYKQDAIRSFIILYWQFALNLIGDDPENDDPKKLAGSITTETKLRRLVREKKNRLLEVNMDDLRCQLAYIFGDYGMAGKIAETTTDYGSKVGQGTFQLPRHSFIVGLTHAALAAAQLSSNNNNNNINKKDGQRHLKIAKSVHKKMSDWLNGGNVNCLHMVKLLEAEISLSRKKTPAAIAKSEDLYKNAILAATRSGFVHDRALSHERAALFFLNTYPRDETFWAVYHLKNAIQCYRDWGATKKVEQLTTTHGSILDQEVPVV